MARSGSASLDLRGQAKVISEVQHKVDAWRGFALGSAQEPYPVQAPRYEAVEAGEHAISDTTRTLLHHWFRHEPHRLSSARGSTLFKYWPHQRRLVETFIYLHEVRRIRRTQALYQLAGVEALGPQRDPWPKLGGQLATGSGKTKMMSLLIAWSYFNAVLEPNNALGLGRHSLLIAPGLFVKDRLLQDFLPDDGRGTPVFWSDPVIPPSLERYWELRVYDASTCPRLLDPDEGALVVTNYHQLLRTREELMDTTAFSREERQMQMLFQDNEPERLEAIQTPLLERFARSRGLLVLNDEAHHVWDEPGHAQFEQKARDKAKLSGEDASTAMAWIRAIRTLNGSADTAGRMGLQVDLSATLFEETGSAVKAGKTRFKTSDLFRHTAVKYDLAEAIQDGIVKKPVLERVSVRNKETNEPEELIRVGQPNAWERYRNLLVTGIERWKKVRDQLRDEGDPRKPLLFILCNDRTEAREVANFLTYGEAVSEDLSKGRVPSGYLDPSQDPTLGPEAEGARLFLEPGPDGINRSTVVEIHIGQKEQSNEVEWNRIRQAVNAVDHDEIPDPSGLRHADGRPVMLPNPYNVVVSVMMLKEGWDVRNVKVIVPLRPCDSRTLTEQTLGRGLRKMHAPEIDDEGAVTVEPEELYVIQHPSFAAILDQIDDLIEQRDSADIDHTRDYVPILQRPDPMARERHEVRLVRFENLIQSVPDWRKGFDVSRIPPLTPRLPWQERFADTEIQTFLKRMLAGRDDQGLQFTLTAKPSYQNFDHILELAYALPLLRELKASFQHKNAVKGVVQEYLERKVFALPLGLPLSFDKVFEQGDALIALGNLARLEVIEGVRQRLLPALHEALTREQAADEALLSVRLASTLENYQAVRKHVMDAPQKTTFDRGAFDNQDELRMARLLDRATDVEGWLYNHRSVGYEIEYDWQGYTARYVPDFVVRARIGAVFHNFILEVKGRVDDRDKVKLRRGQQYCEMLTQYDSEPWHYIVMMSNPQHDRDDIGWWERQSVQEMSHLLRQHERLPLFPEDKASGPSLPVLKLLSSIAAGEKFRSAVPVLDLEAAAGAFSESQEPEPLGWAQVQTSRTLDKRMFVAKVVGRSMQPGIPDGAWCLFRAFPVGSSPMGQSLDGRRVVVQLRDATDPETGGQYTLKRWKVAQLSDDGRLEAVLLQPDNVSFQPMQLTGVQGQVRVVAEFLEVVGMDAG